MEANYKTKAAIYWYRLLKRSKRPLQVQVKLESHIRELAYYDKLSCFVHRLLCEKYQLMTFY